MVLNSLHRCLTDPQLCVSHKHAKSRFSHDLAPLVEHIFDCAVEKLKSKRNAFMKMQVRFKNNLIGKASFGV